MANTPSGFKFPIVNSIQTFSNTYVDMADMFVRKELFLNAGLWVCGYNAYGQLGNGTTSNSYSSPIQIGSLTNWKQISCGLANSAAIKTDGTLWTWGYNGYGQLGNNASASYSSPVQVGTGTNWKQVSCTTRYSTVAVKTDGTLWACGYNNYGQLGNGTIIPYASPIQVGTLTNWKQVACGYQQVSVLKTDGTLWAWGLNTYGQLGNSTFGISYSSPVQVGALTNWKQLSGGGFHTAAIKTDGTLWAWGNNSYGQLGNSASTSISSPIQVGIGTNWKQVGCGHTHTAAIKTDGTLWLWGYNGLGQLGNGTTVNSYSSPIQVGTGTNWKQVSCGGYHTAAIKTDGTLWIWGYNLNGQLGNNSVAFLYSSPIQIGTLTNWKQIACGYYHTTLISAPDLP